jgi:hypothetical protein
MTKRFASFPAARRGGFLVHALRPLLDRFWNGTRRYSSYTVPQLQERLTLPAGEQSCFFPLSRRRPDRRRKRRALRVLAVPGSQVCAFPISLDWQETRQIDTSHHGDPSDLSVPVYQVPQVYSNKYGVPPKATGLCRHSSPATLAYAKVPVYLHARSSTSASNLDAFGLADYGIYPLRRLRDSEAATLCELEGTPRRIHGSIDLSRPISSGSNLAGTERRHISKLYKFVIPVSPSFRI